MDPPGWSCNFEKEPEPLKPSINSYLEEPLVQLRKQVGDVLLGSGRELRISCSGFQTYSGLLKITCSGVSLSESGLMDPADRNRLHQSLQNPAACIFTGCFITRCSRGAEPDPEPGTCCGQTSIWRNRTCEGGADEDSDHVALRPLGSVAPSSQDVLQTGPPSSTRSHGLHLPSPSPAASVCCRCCSFWFPSEGFLLTKRFSQRICSVTPC